MQKLLSVAQMRAADEYTIRTLGVASQELMERAYAASQSRREGATVLASSPLAHVIDDVRIALIDSDGDVMLFTFDSRRFETVPESEL